MLESLEKITADPSRRAPARRRSEAGGCIGCVVPCGLIAVAGLIGVPLAGYALWTMLISPLFR